MKEPPGHPLASEFVAFVAFGEFTAKSFDRPAVEPCLVGPEIEIKIFLGHQISAPGRHATGAIIERADDLFSGRV